MPLPHFAQSVADRRWTAEQAWNWHAARPWITGCNFLPSHASNQLEMWQQDTFDPETLDRELGWLAGYGLNTVRVFLHDLLWKKDSRAFLARMEHFLTIAHRHGISVLPVFFDSCWHPFPRLGPQPPPEPGVHNSTWVQSPGAEVLADATAFSELEEYVRGVVTFFRDDTRILGWDVWNEPDNESPWYAPRELGAAKFELVHALLPVVFHWIREASPTQPLTAGVWRFDAGGSLRLESPPAFPLSGSIARFQIEASDVLSFHLYAPAALTERVIAHLQAYGRPLLCTEYLARTIGSTFEAVLPLFHRARIGAIHWGGITGKSQTRHPWDSWKHPVRDTEAPWFHDLLRGDGAPYDEDEARLWQALTRPLGQ